MASSRSSKRTSASKPQQPDGLTGAGAPVPKLSSPESSRTRDYVCFGGPSHLPHMTSTVGCHGDPVQGSCFPRDGPVVRTLERVPHVADHEVATAQPSTPVHQSHQPEHARDTGARRRHKIKTPPVNHSERNERLIHSLEQHLQSLIRYYSGSSEEHQVYVLNRIIDGLRQSPQVHICRIERKNGDRKGMIMLVICLLCPSHPIFKQPNPLPKFAHHFRTFHCQIKTSFECIVSWCDKTFSLRHDMTRHVHALHDLTHTTSERPQSGVPTGDADGIAEPFPAHNVAGPSNSNTSADFPHAVARNIASQSSHPPTSGPSESVTEKVTDVGLPAPGSSHQTKPSSLRDAALLSLSRHPHAGDSIDMSGLFQSTNGIQTMIDDGGFGSGYARPSASLQPGYMTTENQSWVTRPSSGRSSVSQVEQYGGPSHTSVPGANESATYPPSYGQTVHSPSRFQFGEVPGRLPGGTLQSRQHDRRIIVPQMSRMDDSGYPMNTMVMGVPDTLFLRGSNSIPIEGSRQPAGFPAGMGAAIQHWHNTNDALMSAHHAQYQHGQDGYNGIRDPDQGMSRQYGGLGYIQPASGGSTRHTLPQPHDVETALQNQYPVQHQPNNLPYHGQQATHPPWGHPHNPTDMTLRSPILTPSQYHGHSNYQIRNSSAKAPRHLGDRVSQDKKTLTREVERNLSSWLGLIRRMVGVSGASQSAILVSLAPPWERKRCEFLFLSREGEVHNIDLWGWTLRKWRLCSLWTTVC